LREDRDLQPFCKRREVGVAFLFESKSKRKGHKSKLGGGKRTEWLKKASRALLARGLSGRKKRRRDAGKGE